MTKEADVQGEERQDELSVVVIGMGGIGTALIGGLCKFLQYHNPGSVLTIVDGDRYEPKNFKRQFFTTPGNKAVSKANELQEVYDEISIVAIDQFVSPENVANIIEDDDVVLAGVDNHATRKLLSDHCLTLDNVVLISGGNDYYSGNVMTMARRDGEVVVPTYPRLDLWHDDIREPKDKLPDDESCLESVLSEPQLVFVNGYIAAIMLNVFYTVCIHPCRTAPGDIHVDITKHGFVTMERSFNKEGEDDGPAEAEG